MTDSIKLQRLSAKEFKNLQGGVVKVQLLKTYSFYRSGYNPSENKFHTFVPFPILPEEVIYSGDRIERKEGELTELRERIWNKDIKKFEFRKSSFIDRKLYKKVIDIVAVASEDIVATEWNKEAKGNIEITIPKNTPFTLQEFSCGKVRDLLETFELDLDIKVDPDTNKKPYDWEDGIVNRLESHAFTFRVTGSGLETRYKFKEVPAFYEEEEVGSNITPTQPTTKSEITIEDIPF